jgi:hypothetical protein
MKPYINSDGALFGQEYHTDVQALRKRRDQLQRKRKRESGEDGDAADAQSRDCGLRWEYPGSESPASGETEVWQTEFGFLGSHPSADDGSDFWFGDDDSAWDIFG